MEFNIGDTVICNGSEDKIIDVVTEQDNENFEMGYRYVLENNGTQSPSSLTKMITQ